MNPRVRDQNLHAVGGADILDRQDPRFREYRRQWRDNPAAGIVAAFPLFLDVELTSACNLRCPFCATTYRGQQIPRGFMTGDLFRRIIDEGVEHGLYGAKFNIRGEPLLHREVVAFTAYAKRRGLLDVYFNTNASLLTPEISARLIDAGLDRISISIEGMDAAVYERYRVGARFAVLMRNLEGLRRARDRAGVSHPKIRIQTVMIPELAGALDRYAAHWQPYAEEVAFLDYKEMKEKRRGVVSAWACPELWQRMGIFWDGTILPCNHDDDARLALGTVGRDRLRDCWHSARLGEIRACHRAGRAHELKACDGCYLRDSEIAKAGRE